MHSATDPDPRWTLEDRIAGALLAAAVLGSLPFLVHPWYDPTNDGALYLATARSIAAGAGYTHLGYVFHVRPPGFSLLIAPVVGAFGSDFFALNLTVSGIGALGVLLLFVYQRPYLGGGLAACTALAVWLNPLYERMCNQVMSDVPGITALVACLLVNRWAERQPSWRREIALGVAIGLASYVRSMNLLLLPAIWISRAWRRPSQAAEGPGWRAFAVQRLAVVAAAVALTLLPWSLYKQGRIAPPPSDQTYTYDYLTGMLHGNPGNPDSRRLGAGEILERIPLRARQMASVLGSRGRSRVAAAEEPTAEPFAGHAAATVALLVLAGVTGLRSRRSAEIFCAIALATVAVYFGFRERLVLPIFALALPAAALSVRDGIAIRVGAGRATAATCGLLLLLLAIDTRPRADWSRIETDHRASVSHYRALDEAMGPDARPVVMSDRSRVSVYLARPVPTLDIGVRRARSLDAIEELVDKYDANTVVVTRGVGPASRYLEAKYGPGRTVGRSAFWRVRP
jgi:hypothetical protein